VTRPAVSVVMPFAGTAADARRAASSLLGIELREGDELIIADNSATVPATPGVTVVSAPAERSPAHARNAGAAHARNDWVLFLDADCRPLAGLLDAYFAAPVGPQVGALAGGVVPAAEAATLAARYGAARNFLSAEAHLAHPFRPRAAAANLLVRRSAFEQVGGFYEGLRAAEDTDFSWRLQEAGWRLEIRPEATVEHHYRATLGELRRQWRGYAAGRAWLGRRYVGFTPEPALVRASRRVWSRARGGGAGGGAALAAPRTPAPVARRAFLALDALLALDELAGFALSNRPARAPALPAAVVLVADRFPARGDRRVERARAFPGARVEAARRPEVVDRRAAREVRVEYREDDGLAARAWALAQLVMRHPLRTARLPDDPSLAALAPAALRLARDPGVRVRALDPGETELTARRLAALAGAVLDDTESP
jgi:GT2 family glycosyltransferase